MNIQRKIEASSSQGMGELLSEFLDYFGNHFDPRATGILIGAQGSGRQFGGYVKKLCPGTCLKAAINQICLKDSADLISTGVSCPAISLLLLPRTICSSMRMEKARPQCCRHSSGATALLPTVRITAVMRTTKNRRQSRGTQQTLSLLLTPAITA